MPLPLAILAALKSAAPPTHTALIANYSPCVAAHTHKACSNACSRIRECTHYTTAQPCLLSLSPGTGPNNSGPGTGPDTGRGPTCGTAFARKVWAAWAPRDQQQQQQCIHNHCQIGPLESPGNTVVAATLARSVTISGPPRQVSIARASTTHITCVKSDHPVSITLTSGADRSTVAIDSDHCKQATVTIAESLADITISGAHTVKVLGNPATAGITVSNLVIANTSAYIAIANAKGNIAGPNPAATVVVQEPQRNAVALAVTGAQIINLTQLTGAYSPQFESRLFAPPTDYIDPLVSDNIIEAGIIANIVVWAVAALAP